MENVLRPLANLDAVADPPVSLEGALEPLGHLSGVACARGIQDEALLGHFHSSSFQSTFSPPWEGSAVYVASRRWRIRPDAPSVMNWSTPMSRAMSSPQACRSRLQATSPDSTSAAMAPCRLPSSTSSTR